MHSSQIDRTVYHLHTSSDIVSRYDQKKFNELNWNVRSIDQLKHFTSSFICFNVKLKKISIYETVLPRKTKHQVRYKRSENKTFSIENVFVRRHIGVMDGSSNEMSRSVFIGSCRPILIMILNLEQDLYQTAAERKPSIHPVNKQKRVLMSAYHTFYSVMYSTHVKTLT